GTDGSPASASTRALNSSHDRSRSSSSPASPSPGAGSIATFFVRLLATGPPCSHGGDALDGPGFGVVEDEVLVGDDPQRSPDGVEEFAGPQEEVGVLGAAEALVADGERLVQEDVAGADGGHDVIEDRPME